MGEKDEEGENQKNSGKSSKTRDLPHEEQPSYIVAGKLVDLGDKPKINTIKSFMS